MKAHLFASFLLFLFLLNLSASGQSDKLRNRTISPTETGETEGEETGNTPSDLSPDTAKTLVFVPNINAAYTQRPFSAPLHNFHFYTIAENSREIYQNLGNPGTAANPISFRLEETNGLSFRKSANDLYTYQLDSIRFYIPEKPFSELNYMMGKGKEQQLLFSHSQQVRKGLILGFHARFANAPGIYLRQRTYYSTGYFTLNYTLPSRRYGIMAAYLNDRFRNYENGGIVYDTVFRDNTESKRETISVNLKKAINRSKNSSFLLQHYFLLQKPGNLKPDTSQAHQRKRFDAGRLVHTFKFEQLTSAYEDDNASDGRTAGFYPATYGDSTTTLDSTFHIRFSNTFVYSNIEPDTAARSFPFQYSFGISHQMDRIGYGNIESQAKLLLPSGVFGKTDLVGRCGTSEQFTQLMPFGTLKGIIARKTFFIANGKLSVGGYTSGDHELAGSFYQYFGDRKKQNRIYFTLRKGMRHPDYFYNLYYSNHYRWQNDFDLQDYVNATAGINFFGYDISATFTRISNYVWLNESAIPQQYSGGLAITRADAHKVFRPGHWLIDTHLILQEVSRDSILPLPALIAKGSISYSALLFKKALLIEGGISGYYYTSYYADAYMPELRMFYRQSVEKFGNYPYMDVFLNMKVKRARIFIRYQHFNAGLMGYSYYTTPHYPGADAAFKAGVSWVFYD